MKGEEKWKNSRSNLQPFNRNWNGDFNSFVLFFLMRNDLIDFFTLRQQILFWLCSGSIHSYKNYGSGPAKYPLADMLQFVLEFATTKPSTVSPAEDPRLTSSSPTPSSPPLSENICKDNRLKVVSSCKIPICHWTYDVTVLSGLSNEFSALLSKPGDADSSEGLVSSCQRTPIHKPFTQCRPPIESPPHPAPHSITDEELHFVKTCLQRWRTEVENDINGNPGIAHPF